MVAVDLLKILCLLYTDAYWKDDQADVWKQGKLSVWKQNRSSAKKQKFRELTGSRNS